MIEVIQVFETAETDPYTNLGTEKLLLDKVQPGNCILYLWQNENTVVIGSNQNPWKECRISNLEADGGKLARRLSGGGAVFHDLGNLNFTFLMCEEDYNVSRQLQVIQQACAALGITATASGRNDLLADGKKFSGNAFYHHNGKAYHHGTILINANMVKMQKYLSPPKAKLEAKGVSSVRSRVTNLSAFVPGLTCRDMAEKMKIAFSKVYNHPIEQISLNDTDIATVETLRQQFSDWGYLFGKALPFSFECEEKFSWGHICLQLNATAGVIQNIQVYTDAMDWSLAPTLEQALTGCKFTLDALKTAVNSADIDPIMKQDLYHLLADQSI